MRNWPAGTRSSADRHPAVPAPVVSSATTTSTERTPYTLPRRDVTPGARIRLDLHRCGRSVPVRRVGPAHTPFGATQVSLKGRGPGRLAVAPFGTVFSTRQAPTDGSSEMNDAPSPVLPCAAVAAGFEIGMLLRCARTGSGRHARTAVEFSRAEAAARLGSLLA